MTTVAFRGIAISTSILLICSLFAGGSLGSSIFQTAEAAVDKTISKSNGIGATATWIADGFTSVRLSVVEGREGTHISLFRDSFFPIGELDTDNSFFSVGDGLRTATLSPVEMKICVLFNEFGDCLETDTITIAAQWENGAVLSRDSTKESIDFGTFKTRSADSLQGRDGSATMTIDGVDLGPSSSASVFHFKRVTIEVLEPAKFAATTAPFTSRVTSSSVEQVNEHVEQAVAIWDNSPTNLHLFTASTKAGTSAFVNFQDGDCTYFAILSTPEILVDVNSKLTSATLKLVDLEMSSSDPSCAPIKTVTIQADWTGVGDKTGGSLKIKVKNESGVEMEVFIRKGVQRIASASASIDGVSLGTTEAASFGTDHLLSVFKPLD